MVACCQRTMYSFSKLHLSSRPMSITDRHRDSDKGFTLVEMAIVLLIVGLSLGMVLNISTGMRDSQNRQLVKTKLATLDTALANFVAQNRRLPCPANGTLASGAANAGLETLNVATGLCNPANQVNGVIPWVTLGISEEDATDPWNARMTYRVDPQLARDLPSGARLMNMSNCDPAGTGGIGAGGTCQAPTPPCASNPATCTSPTSFLANKGLDVWNGVGGAAGWATRQNNRAAGTGAAYVIISHGPSGTGAYNSSGTLQPGTIAAGTDETPNLNNQAVPAVSAQATTYRSAPLNDVATAAHFDDYLSHPPLMSVLNKVSLGPRAH